MKNIKLIAVLLFAAMLTWQCTSEQEPIPEDCSISSPVLALASKVDASGGQANGSITLTTGSIATGVIITVNGNAQTSAVISNLAAGSYLIVATGNGGCTTELRVDILNLDGVNATTSTTDSSCGNATGTISVDANGGTAPYMYKLGNDAFQANATFMSLSPGDYDVTVRDAGGSEVALQVTVTSDIDFGHVNTIIQTNCAVSGCHNGTQSPDLRAAATIQSRASRIEARTGAKTMPPSSSGRTLTDAEIAEIACWVADGAPGN